MSHETKVIQVEQKRTRMVCDYCREEIKEEMPVNRFTWSKPVMPDYIDLHQKCLEEMTQAAVNKLKPVLRPQKDEK